MANYFERENDWLIPKDDAHFETLTASLLGTSKAFQKFAEKEAARFCGAVRSTPILTIFFLTNPERKDWRASPDDLPREKNTPYGVFNFALFFSATCWR